MVPDDVAAALPASIDRAAVAAHARLYGAIDAPLGETHLVLSESRVIAVTRVSSFEPFRVVECAPRDVRLDTSSFSRVLSLTTTEGAAYSIEVSILDVTAVSAFVAALPEVQPGPPVPISPAPSPVIAPATAVVAVVPPDGARAALLHLLATQVARGQLLALLHAELARRKSGLRERIVERKRAPIAEPQRAKPPEERFRPKQKPRAPKSPRAVIEEPAPLLRPAHWAALVLGVPLLWLLAQVVVHALRR